MTIIEALRQRNNPRLRNATEGASPPSVDPKTTEIINNMVANARELSELRDAVSSLEAELAETRRHNAFLDREVDLLRHERDFYMRHSTTIVARLNDIGMLIGQTLDEAKRAAFTPKLAAEPPRSDTSAAKPQPVHNSTDVPEDNEGARDIARRLAPEPIPPLTTQDPRS